LINLIYGRAGTGKTAYVYNDFKERMLRGETGMLLIVPEQYSHDAEKQLCGICGDSLPLHGETLSFTRLCGHVIVETCGALQIVDGGGQVLIMHRAIEAVLGKLKVYRSKSLKAELIKTFLSAIGEFKNNGISAKALENFAKDASNPLSDKLCDLSLIYAVYESHIGARGYDTADKMSLLAEFITDSSVGQGHIYFDGFNDFTFQELQVIEKLMIKNAEMTFCLTCDYGAESEVFDLPNDTALKLKKMAKKLNIEVSEVHMQIQSKARAPELNFLEEHLFSFETAKYPETNEAISIYNAPTNYNECEYAAHIICKLVSDGYRYKEIGVMSRNQIDYGSVCESVFEKYGIPFFSSGKQDVLLKPPTALIDAALSCAALNWEYRSIFKYIKTGLTGISPDRCAELENYAIKWNIRGAAWQKNWTLPPDGYGGKEDAKALKRLNEVREKIISPLFNLKKAIKGETKASEKILALYNFLQEIEFPKQLSDKSEELEKRGDLRLADEYTQLWDIITNAMEQMYTILGEEEISEVMFQKLFALTISQYTVGVIPVSLDAVLLGGMEMSRRRDLKCLIILGATDDKLPMISKSDGLLSDSERLELSKLGAEISSGLSEQICREMNMLYSTLTLPSQKLALIYPGGTSRPSHIIKKISEMFDITEKSLCQCEYMTTAEEPCFELALKSKNGATCPAASAAREYFIKKQDNRAALINKTDNFLKIWREGMSKSKAENLYGQKLTLSASGIDNYFSCAFKHFLQSGMKLKKLSPAEFDAAQNGIFMHYVIEGVIEKTIKENELKDVGSELLEKLCDTKIAEFAEQNLFNFEGKNERFVYLFRRLGEDVKRVAADMLGELKRSDFVPCEFEHRFYQPFDKQTGKDRVYLTGIVDRIDIFNHNGEKYLRVIDYKTGKKAFRLPDILQGRNMQMLIYLFALTSDRSEKFGKDYKAAGMLYVPARDAIVKAPRNASCEEIEKEKTKALKRGGLISGDPEILEAMEKGETKKYLPVKIEKDGTYSGDSVIDAQQTELLKHHVKNMLKKATDGILCGNIERKPYYKGANENACLFCDYRGVCAFDEEMGDRRNVVRKKTTEEVWDALRKWSIGDEV
jgi:ATP-dependent helicase/nuclease subunit B